MVKVYTTPVCPYCYTLKEFLKGHNVQFEEVDVSQDEKARDEMIKKSGQMVAPVVDVEGQIVIGFDKAKLFQLLKLKD